MIKLGPALPCPRCKRVLASSSWHDEHSGRCEKCTAEFKFFPFPALHAKAARIAPQAVVVAEESVCFFHAGNRAESVCEECGRLLCSVCAVNFGGRKICPTCIATAKESPATQVVRERALVDSIALTLALAPLLVWPLTLVSAPIALWYTYRNWKMPGSLVRGSSRTRLVLAMVFAGAELIGWTIFFISLAT